MAPAVSLSLSSFFATVVVAGSMVAGITAQHDQAVKACSALNFTLKAEMMRGFGLIDGYSRNSGCAYLCGRKTFRWDNGPQGYGDNSPPGTSTQWPATLTVASTFDPNLAEDWGTAMGEEFWSKGANIQEGPGVNVARVMKNGRNFEYMSGEDPVLGSMMLPPVINGIQKNVMSITKHYILNNQETHRSGVNEVCDETTMMELYGPPFEAAVQTSTGIMCSYNRINGDWACENQHTLKTMLKGYYNFSGFVVSDWGATHSTSPSLEHGLDIEMPEGKYFVEDNIKAAITSGNITMENIDDTCIRILTAYYTVPEDRRMPCDGGNCIGNNVSTAEHKALARKLSSMATVLLKNDGNLLPLHKSLKVALIGPDAMKPYTAGSGSGSVHTNAVVSAVTAFTRMGISVSYDDGSDTSSAVKVAKAADVAIVFGSAHSGEGSDRDSLNLTGNIDQLIPVIAAAQKKTVVILTVPGSILTPWRDNVPAVLTNFFPGEQVGPALYDVLFGDVPPQAKLPVTFPSKDNEQGFSTEQWPGVSTPEFKLQANYSEGQIVGYRWYDKHNVKPAYPFGHGLTYGSFEYSGLKTSGKTISFSVKRTAGSGCDTPQLYISYPTASSDPMVPAKVLRYFEKTCSDSATISYTLTDRDVSNWDVLSKQWKVTSGTYAVSVGSSSQDIRLTGSVTI